MKRIVADKVNNIEILKYNGQRVVSSRQVAKNFDKDHFHVLRDIETIKKDVSSFGLMFFESTLPDKYGREQKVFLMNKDGWTLLTMGFRGAKAIQWKLKYIEAFNKMEEQLQLNFDNPIPQTFSQALKLAWQQQELIEKQEALLLDQKPLVSFAETCMTSKTSILVRQLAKIASKNGIVIGQNRLYSKLREWKFIMKNSTEPTQTSIDKGLLEVQERPVETPYETILTRTTFVTPRGQIHIIERLREELV